MFIRYIVRCGVESCARVAELLLRSNPSVLQNPPAFPQCGRSFADSSITLENACRYTCASAMNFGAKHGNESALSRSRNLTERKGAFERASTALLGEEALQPSS
jgi:hypothetical protein